MKLPAKIEKGQIKFWRPEDFKTLVSKLEGKEVFVSIEKQTRHNKQNAYYWSAVITAIANEMGELEPEEVHEILKQRILPKQFKQIRSKKTGDIIEVEIPKSTTNLKTDEFYQYVEKCKAWASIHLGVSIEEN